MLMVIAIAITCSLLLKILFPFAGMIFLFAMFISDAWFLQYAHRRCVQRWCNEKGNTTCEICQQVDTFPVHFTFHQVNDRIFFDCNFFFFGWQFILLWIYASLVPRHLRNSHIHHVELSEFQQFKPGYTAPPPLFQFGNIPMNFR